MSLPAYCRRVTFVITVPGLFDSVNGFDFLEVVKWTSAAYLIARGIAKAVACSTWTDPVGPRGGWGQPAET